MESPTAVNLGILSRSPVFQAAPLSELERLAPRCLCQRYRKGAEIIRRGTLGDALVVIGRGRAKGTLPSPGGEGEHIMALMGPGEVFGEIPVFDQRVRAGSAVAIIETEALFVPRNELLPLLERRPAVAMRMLETICGKFRMAIDQSLSLRFLDLPSRFYQKLAYLASLGSSPEGHGVKILHGLSQQELADTIGASREALNKLIADWKRAGLLESGRGYLVITDPAALLMRLPSSVRHDSILGTVHLGPSSAPAMTAHPEGAAAN